MHTAQDIEQAIRAAANPDKVKTLSGFFKTGKGEYGEKDIFIGIPVPVTRSIVKQYLDTPLDQLEILLHNPVHELRMAALLCMVEQFKKPMPTVEKRYTAPIYPIPHISTTGIWSIYPQHKSSDAISKKKTTPHSIGWPKAASSGNNAFRLSPLGNGSAKAVLTTPSLLPIFSCTTNMT